MHRKLFPSQKPDEKLYIVARQHWFILFKRFVVVFILFLIPFFIIPIILNTGSVAVSDNIRSLVYFLRDVYWTGLFVAAFIVWAIYYLNLYIVSEERVVDIDQLGLLKQVVSELNIETVEDVTSETIGLFGSLLNYGTVYIQTAGASERFEFENVPNPAEVANVVLTLFEAQNDKNARRF